MKVTRTNKQQKQTQTFFTKQTTSLNKQPNFFSTSNKQTSLNQTNNFIQHQTNANTKNKENYLQKGRS